MTLEGARQGIESGRCACQIPGSQGLTNRREVLCAIGAMESVAICQRAIFAESNQRIVRLLRGRCVPGFQRVPQLLKVGLPLLIELLP